MTFGNICIYISLSKNGVSEYELDVPGNLAFFSL